jgi:hypothetical protein
MEISLQQLSSAVSMTLAAVMLIAGAAHCYPPASLARIYPRRDHAEIPHRVRGILRIAAALLLIVPQMRIWGGTLAAVTAFFAVIALLRDARYSWAIPGVMVMMAVPMTMIPPSLF